MAASSSSLYRRIKRPGFFQPHIHPAVAAHIFVKTATPWTIFPTDGGATL